jgi:hypothetical protein
MISVLGVVLLNINRRRIISKIKKIKGEIMRNQYIISTAKCYADEFYVLVFSIFTEETQKVILKHQHYLDEDDVSNMYFGTNEALEFTLEEVLGMIQNAELISEGEAMILENRIPDLATVDIVGNLFDVIGEKAYEASDDDTISELDIAYESWQVSR